MGNKTSMNLEENVASMLCYIATWFTGIIFYLVEKENKKVRFHALQSIIIFLPLTILAPIIGWIGAPKPVYSTVWGVRVATGYDSGIFVLQALSWLIYVVIFILWIILMIKAYQGEKFKLPIVGDIAEKHA